MADKLQETMLEQWSMYPALTLLKCKGNSQKEGDSLNISVASVRSSCLSAFPFTVALGAMAGLRLRGLASSKLYQRRQDRLSGTGSLLSNRTDTAAGIRGYVSEMKGTVLLKCFPGFDRCSVLVVVLFYLKWELSAHSQRGWNLFIFVSK